VFDADAAFAEEVEGLFLPLDCAEVPDLLVVVDLNISCLRLRLFASLWRFLNLVVVVDLLLLLFRKGADGWTVESDLFGAEVMVAVSWVLFGADDCFSVRSQSDVRTVANCPLLTHCGSLPILGLLVSEIVVVGWKSPLGWLLLLSFDLIPHLL
jgi:hypothetical protein